MPAIEIVHIHDMVLVKADTNAKTVANIVATTSIGPHLLIFHNLAKILIGSNSGIPQFYHSKISFALSQVDNRQFNYPFPKIVSKRGFAPLFHIESI